MAEWIEWGGGDCPDGIEPEAVVEVKYRDGYTLEHVAWHSEGYWTHCGDECDIVAYRVVKV